MICFNFEYYKPSSIKEAIELYQTSAEQRKEAIFYSGGTEFITFARINQQTADVVIDIKGIPECNRLEVDQEKITIGSAVSLNHLVQSNAFPLLTKAVKNVADHSSRNKITIGGNINSRLMYREGLLPLLLANAKVRMAGPSGERIQYVKEIVGNGLSIKPGELLIQIMLDIGYAGLPHTYLKKTRMTKVGYPLVSIAALVKDSKLSIAFSGLCEYPFTSDEINQTINDTLISEDEKVKNIIASLPTNVKDDQYGSAEYRKFVLKNTLHEIFTELE